MFLASLRWFEVLEKADAESASGIRFLVVVAQIRYIADIATIYVLLLFLCEINGTLDGCCLLLYSGVS